MSNSKAYREYSLDKERYLELLHFCRQYRQKKEQVKSCYALRAVSYDDNGAAGVGHPTENRAILAEQLNKECQMIEEAVQIAVEPAVIPFLLNNVTCENMPYELLGNVPMGRQQFYEARRKFFFVLSILKMG